MSTVAVIGLGYVGLPLVVEFSKVMRTIGFDINADKVAMCNDGIDPSCELSNEEMSSAQNIIYTNNPSMLTEADIVIVAVPTPVDKAMIPDFHPLISASELVGRYMKSGVTVVYESTVYPGATEEVCIPVLERASGLVWGKDFFVGYSPERINPGDKEHTLTKILKIVSGDSPETLERVASLYEQIIIPGVFRAGSIKIAEAAKVIENTQRDINIALMNELSLIFNMLGIDTSAVLQAAGTKWNFLKFKPGLVGGHCIGVDPYYLTYKAKMLGYHPKMIQAGRSINDGMGKYIAEQTVKCLISSGMQVKGALVNILGVTFKENCADIRNSKVIDIVNELKKFDVDVCVSDVSASSNDVYREYGLDMLEFGSLKKSSAVIVAVSHNEYRQLSPKDFETILVPNGVIVDVKSMFDIAPLHAAGFSVWRL
ncbi:MULTISPECIES: nucleotide sugar dehydrogenase [Desulfovibrio]|uniref:UDP-N-acetyl-D-galactosamine dehydrogenase n=1 Tax=Desulfovibrio desulfuricans TaxID=876 RepID=A0AA94HU05_DESDE|nr:MULTISPECIES: nucleotide sugar dehydrogenase [Desulfovibrio]ATD80938.1 nucleotide sugar dehydrogenase [Desulfovibrio sp. G11]SFW62078.1 UDP-N-acetyl-D-galactosamine dehydrogenase [Desulfovibrio desulfuricans]SPD36503.1 UDP-N-acetyl-D-mannosamine/glucosamine dehydrogenase [Desulfovibrio sp. G11]